MKRLFLASFCLALGAGAFAADAKTAKPATGKATVKTANSNAIVVSTKKQEVSQFRIQRQILTQDLCGNHIVVYVSGPNNSTWLQMYDCATTYVSQHLDSNGCFNG